MDKNEEQRIKEKLNFFYSEKVRVHVSRFDKKFWRGYIIGIKEEGVYQFIEDKIGECLLFVADIHDVNLFREEKK